MPRVSIPFRPTNTNTPNFSIAGVTGNIFLPHLKRESQPPIETFLKMSIFTYFYAFGLPKKIVALAFWDEMNEGGAN